MTSLLLIVNGLLSEYIPLAMRTISPDPEVEKAVEISIGSVLAPLPVGEPLVVTYLMLHCAKNTWEEKQTNVSISDFFISKKSKVECNIANTF